MDARAREAYMYSHPAPGKYRRRSGRKTWTVAKAVLLLAAVVLLAVIGKVVLDGLRELFSFPDTGGTSDISFTPAESTVGDTTAPVLSGVKDFTVYQGDAIAYLAGVAAADETDPEPSITVDSSAVDLSRPGEYQVIYTATDAAGNSSRETATVTVLEIPESFVDVETIYAAADAKLSEIIRENATVKQQVHDIYAWARLNLRYGGHSDRADWRQTAYVMLTDGQGDCFGFYAVTKLLFERLGIPNIDVRKVKNSEDDTDHFWSLVSLDGGETWYHFDATPRAGEGDDFCLVTDTFIDAYSEAHGGSHNRDRSLYPETP